ncbi:uncharacterized protein LOC62_01G000461 [Vanrija pseudolonga]|uniref:Uncharacterized protein n=1 Tax=Vanrija pseudolonga TaxID=143232 RepID=A0AAF0Y3C4_9TREE|nr:hypothetical protein LOC62_01G000461 [Vanrija pseudolonga]
MPSITPVLEPYITTYPRLQAAYDTAGHAIPTPVDDDTLCELSALVCFLQFHRSPAKGAPLAAALKLQAEVNVLAVGGVAVAANNTDNGADALDRHAAQRADDLAARVNDLVDALAIAQLAPLNCASHLLRQPIITITVPGVPLPPGFPHQFDDASAIAGVSEAQLAGYITYRRAGFPARLLPPGVALAPVPATVEKDDLVRAVRTLLGLESVTHSW